MITIKGNDIWRGGEKIGWISGNDIFNADGIKIGYFSESAEDIFNKSGRKIGYIENSKVKRIDGSPIDLNDIQRQVQGGTLSSIARAAIRLLLGE